MNPDTGIPEIHTEAALRAVDVVLCKSRLCVELMAAFRKDKSMRFGIMYTNHTTPDPLRLGARHPRACSRLRLLCPLPSSAVWSHAENARKPF